MSARLRYRFSVVRFMPNQIRGEFVNIGVILHVLETQQLLAEWLPGLGRMHCLSPNVTIDEYKNFQQHISKQYNLDSSLSTLDAPGSIIGEPFNKSQPELLDYLHREWTTPFQFSEPVTGFTYDPRKQLANLYNQIAHPVENTAELAIPRTSIERVRRKVERELDKVGLLGPDKFIQNIEASGLTRNWPFDFGRINGRLTLLEVVNLDLKDPLQKANRAMVLNGWVNDIRKKGDYPTSDIDTFAVVNYSKRAENMDGVEEAKKLLKENGIKTVEEGTILEMIEPLKQIIKAPKNYYFNW